MHQDVRAARSLATTAKPLADGDPLIASQAQRNRWRIQSWRLSVGACALTFSFLGGCAVDGMGMNGDTQTARSVLEQAENILLGQDGRIRMPLDYVEAGALDGQGNADANGVPPQATTPGKVIEQAGGAVYRLQVPDLEDHLIYQQHPQWCWAAAIQTVEQYQLQDRGYRLDQRSIVQRIYPDPRQVQDQTALSFQIAEALASEPLRRELGNINLEGEQLALTRADLADVFNVAASSDISTRKLVDYLDQYVGTQELVASLSRGEPLLASLAEPSEEQPLRHIYVVYEADVVPIPATSSREFKLRNVHRIAQRLSQGERLDEYRGILQTLRETTPGDIVNRLQEAPGKVAGLFQGADQQYYALKRVRLLDPWKNPGQPTPSKPQIVEVSGDEFADRAFFLINRTTADRILNELREKQNQMVGEVAVAD